MLGEHLIGAQIAASDLAGAWWRPSAGVSRADRRRGEGPRDPVAVSRAYAAHLERAGDPHALTVLRALQVGADPEWRPAVAAAADRLASRGVREPRWWPPERERVGRCCTFPWDLLDGRFDALTIEVFQGALPIALSVVLDAEGTITDVLLLTEMVALFEMPEEHGGTIEGDPRWRAPGDLADRLEQAIDRTDSSVSRRLRASSPGRATRASADCCERGSS